MVDLATIRNWNLNKLPTDDYSTENAIWVLKTDKWPLMIDPQY